MTRSSIPLFFFCCLAGCAEEIKPCGDDHVECTSDDGVTACVDVGTDPGHCGSCGNACLQGEKC
jgi:hypothetical protein